MNKKFIQSALIGLSLIDAWLAIALLAPSSWIKVTLSAAFLLLAPGYMLFKLITKNHQTGNFWATLAYSVGLSTLYLMLIGLLVNTFLPLFGLIQPLTAAPLSVAITLSLAGLAAATVWRHGHMALLPQLTWRTRPATEWGLLAYGALLPILAAGGAITLNNQGSNWLSITALSLTTFYLVLLIWHKDNRTKQIFPYALYMSSLAFLLSISLRGWHITGHDIMQEYQVFQLTSQHGIWNMKFLQDAYNACLSITILPTILTKLTGVNDTYVFKAIYPFIFALVPPTLYLLLKRFTADHLALLATFVFITFPTFGTDMPMLGRQEMAFLFFVLALLTIFNEQLTSRTRSILTLVLGLGIILSHYSTSYVAVGIIILMKMLELGLNLWSRFRNSTNRSRFVAPLSWPIALILLLSVHLWNSQITNTGQGITKTINGILRSAPQLLTQSGAKTGESKYSLLGKSPSAGEIFKQYVASAHKQRDLAASEYYPDTVTANYPVEAKKEAVTPTTTVGATLGDAKLLSAVYDLIKNSYAKLLQLLILAGLVAMAWRNWHNNVPRQYKLLGFASVCMIGLQVVLPSSVIDYGPLRLLLQSLLFLALPIVLVCYSLLGWLKLSDLWRSRIIALFFAGFFMVLSGLVPAITGGYKAALATNNSGFYYEAYYTHSDEIAGFDWLKQNVPLGAVVNSDEFARRKMIGYTGIYARSAMLPGAISKDAYVYISHGNSTFGTLPVYSDGDLIYQQPPMDFLNDNKDLLYSNGQVKIYQ